MLNSPELTLFQDDFTGSQTVKKAFSLSDRKEQVLALLQQHFPEADMADGDDEDGPAFSDAAERSSLKLMPPSRTIAPVISNSASTDDCSSGLIAVFQNMGQVTILYRIVSNMHVNVMCDLC